MPASQGRRQMNGKTLKITRYFGINVRRMQGSDDRWYITMVIWYPRENFTRLGYLYPSFRFV